MASLFNYTGPHAAASPSLNNSTPNTAAPPEAPANTRPGATIAPPVLENSEPEVTTTLPPLDNSELKTAGTSSQPDNTEPEAIATPSQHNNSKPDTSTASLSATMFQFDPINIRPQLTTPEPENTKTPKTADNQPNPIIEPPLNTNKLPVSTTDLSLMINTQPKQLGLYFLISMSKVCLSLLLATSMIHR